MDVMKRYLEKYIQEDLYKKIILLPVPYKKKYIFGKIVLVKQKAFII